MSAFLPESDSEDELPPGWEERATISGEVYYANHQQSSTQWEHPRTGQKKTVQESLPFGWDRQILPDNKVVYVDVINKKTTYTDPRLAFAKEKVGSTSTFRQKWDASTTAQQVLHGKDLTGKMALITGANSGIGFEVSRALALQGCHVLLACRDPELATATMSRLRSERPSVQVTCVKLDLASLSSVRRAALQVRALIREGEGLDFLVLGAGVLSQRYTITEDGLEMGMQVNFLGQAYFVLLLTKMLCSALQSRVVFLSSESHRFSSFSSSAPSISPSFSPLVFSPGPTHFHPQLQYNDSKLACLLFSYCLQRRYSHLGLTSLSVHPGNLVATSLYRHSILLRLLSTLLRPWTKSPAQAAASVVAGLVEDTGPAFTGYINNCFPSRPMEEAEHLEFQEQLWELTREMLEQKLGPDCLKLGDS